MMVRFRFVYVWVGVAVCAVLLIVDNVVVYTAFLRGVEPSAGSVGIIIGFPFYISREFLSPALYKRFSRVLLHNALTGKGVEARGNRSTLKNLLELRLSR